MAQAMKARQKTDVDPRNTLNDLTSKQWIRYSKSFWFQKGLGADHQETAIERRHPAPFSYKIVQKLILLFTKPRMTVLDPFCGVASTLKAAALSGRNGVGIEIAQRWVTLGKERLAKEVSEDLRKELSLRIIRGDCLKRLPRLSEESIDFIVTSPPFWNILGKDPDKKVKAARLEKGLRTDYSDSPSDLGNIGDYDEFLDRLEEVASECLRVLRRNRYAAIIAGDFRHGSRFYPFHMDLTTRFMNAGFSLQGIIILAQNNKTLFPYGYPHAFVENIHHQYVMVFRRTDESRSQPRMPREA